MKPNALEVWEEIASKLSSFKKIALFLDYDGTLTPIVARPELAILSSQIKKVLTRLATRYPLAIISGRDLKNVQELVGIDGIYYAGSHGFDIMGPKFAHCVLKKGDEYFLRLEALFKRVKQLFDFEVIVERKTCSIALHYRQLSEAHFKSFKEGIEQLVLEFPEFKLSSGKKVFEFQPNILWDKGKALFYLLETMALQSSDVCPIYIGDDITDEDAFLSIKGKGVGIAVLDRERETHASFTLRGVEEVKKVLELL